MRAALLAGTGPETVLLCEHDAVITAGRNARAEHILAGDARRAALGLAVCTASRGGDVTIHAPGQLVAYPILKLRAGIVDHFERMSAAVTDVLSELGIAAAWDRHKPGVWVGNNKICAFGVQVRRGVSVHGLALNLTNDLSLFDTVVPCGLKDAGVTSVARLRPGAAPSPAALAPRLGAALEAAFARPPRETRTQTALLVATPGR